MIDAALYKQVSDAMGEVYSLGNEAVTRLQSISTIFSQTAVPAQKAADVTNATAAVTAVITAVTNRHVNVSPTLRTLVRALQARVEAGYGSVDDFLDAEAVLVSADFASLSEECGYPINSANVAAV